MRSFFLFFVTILWAVASYSQTDLNRGLVAYYPFNGNANDVSGNGLNGILRNGVQLTTDKYGNPNSAYLFDGVDDYIEILDDAKLRFRDSFSICISFMKSAQPGGNLIEKRDLFNGTNSSFDLAAGSSGANGAIKTNDNCGDALSFDYTSLAPAPALNQWYCIVLTFNNGTLKFFQDGVLISSTTTTSTRMDSCSGSSIRIGYHLDFDPIAMNGKIDEVRLYNRELNSNEIQAYCNLSTFCDNWLHIPNSQSYVTVGEIDIPGQQITVEGLFARDSAFTPEGYTSLNVVSKHWTPNDVNYLLRVDRAEITTSNGFFTTPAICALENKRVYHAAMTYDGSTLKFYRNGFLMSQIPCTGDMFQNDYLTTIGATANSPTTNTQLIGYLNEVRIWNVVKTQAELQASMNGPLSNPQLQTGLLGYYTFDNLLNKQGNAAYNGTLHGAASINNTNPNCSFNVDSCATVALPCNNYLKMPNALSGVTVGDLDITGNKVTIEAICNATGDTTRALVSKHEYPGDVNYFLCPDLAQITTTNGFFSVGSSCPFVNNKTYHVALVYDGTTLKLYRNGFLLGETPATGNLVTNNWPTTIGEYAYSLYNGLGNISNIFKGYISEVRIWNIARTQGELKTYMNSPLPSPTTQVGLMGYYTFDDLTNKQGNAAYNGTLEGAASINNTNPDCNFVADSCAVLSLSCDTWLNTPDKLTGVSIGELDITGNQMTIEAMCNATDVYGLSRALVSKHGWQANCNYFLCPDLAQITTTDGFFSASSPCTFVSNKTYHVAMVYNGTSLRLYRNGFLMEEVPATGNLVTNNWPAIIGEYAYAMYFNNASISNIFKGYINEVRIWNVARTQQQIKDYMNTQLPDPTTQTGLLGYYNFDDLTNKQGNALFDGTLEGAATINNTNSSCSFIADSCPPVLPVRIISFTTKVTAAKKIQVSWETEEEYNIEDYTVLRSTSPNDGFTSVGRVQSGKTNSRNKYSFTDNTAKPNVMYFYRLKIVENTGAKRFTEVKKAMITAKGLFVNVYPNPTAGYLFVEISNTNEKAAINLYNNTGQLLLQKNMIIFNNGTAKINISNLAKGSYWLQVTTGKETTVKRIQKL